MNAICVFLCIYYFFAFVFYFFASWFSRVHAAFPPHSKPFRKSAGIDAFCGEESENFISTRKISPFYGKTCNLLSKVQKRMKQNDFWSRGKIGTKVRNFFLKSQNFPAQIPNRQKENAKGHKKVQTCDFPQINAKKTQKVSELPPGDGFLLPSQKGGG